MLMKSQKPEFNIFTFFIDYFFFESSYIVLIFSILKYKII